MYNMKMTFMVILVVMIASIYLIFQCASVVAYSNFSRNIVVATRLLTAEFVDINRTAAGEDFALLLTFENPSAHTLNVTSIVSDYYITQDSGSVFTATGNTAVLAELSPGLTQVVLPMLKVDGQFSAPEHFQCIVYYRLEFGSAHYRFRYFAYDSVEQTIGPYILGGEDLIFPQVATYALLVIDSWAIGLEIIAVMILLQDRKSRISNLVPEDKGHHKMAAIIYALQGIGLFIFLPFVDLLRNSVTPPTEAYSTAGAFSAYIFVGLVELAGLILLLISWSLLISRRAAMYAALTASAIIAFLSLYAVFSILMRPATEQDWALVTLSFATLVANAIAFYILLKQSH